MSGGGEGGERSKGATKPRRPWGRDETKKRKLLLLLLRSQFEKLEEVAEV